MPDYKELNLTMMRETEKAIRILVEAQKNWEERYLQSEEMEKLDGDNGTARKKKTPRSRLTTGSRFYLCLCCDCTHSGLSAIMLSTLIFGD